MRARFAAVVMAALLGSAACADPPASDAGRTGAGAEAAQPAATTEVGPGAPATQAPSEDATPAPAGATASAELPTGSLPPGRPVAPEAEPEPRSLDLAALGVDRGSPQAPVRVIEFSDYGCGYCRKFHQETWPALRSEFVEAGKVEWKFLPYVSGMFKNSSAATTAAECALEQGDRLFEAMNSLIWDKQRDWKGAPDPLPTLRGLAGEAGTDVGRYDSCMQEGRAARRVEAASAVAEEAGVRATPTFFVVGYPPIQGALPTEAFRQILSMVHAEATRAGGGR